jgi:hypothetical protein
MERKSEEPTIREAGVVDVTFGKGVTVISPVLTSKSAFIGF